MPTPKQRRKATTGNPLGPDIPKIEPGYRGFLVVRLRPGSLSADRPEKIPAIADVLKRFGVSRVSPLITSFGLDELRARELKWRVSPEKSLSWYWRLDTRHLEGARTEDLRIALAKLDVVERAYVDPPASNPVNPSNDPLVHKQRYLNPAPTGIDAKWAWDQPGGSGDGVLIVDIEAGWHTHRDLPALKQFHGVPVEINGGLDCKHGTMILGILVGRDNRLGIVGIAPDAAISNASHWRSDPTGAAQPVDPNACTRAQDPDVSLSGHVADAVYAVLDHMSAGDVLLLEVQKPILPAGPFAMPTELVEADFTAIQTATDEGIVVVECAGNSAHDLDGLPVLNPGDPLFQDSGAIMVAGCEAKVSTQIIGGVKVKGHKRWFGSNFGSRIDCHAFGEKVTTTGLDAALGSTFVHNFQGTSAAGAIVAGAAAVVQSARKGNGQVPLTPQQLRDLFRTTGTPQFPGVESIGMMPNLKTAIPAALALP
jgi:subtilisin family serine protease